MYCRYEQKLEAFEILSSMVVSVRFFLQQMVFQGYRLDITNIKIKKNINFL